MHHLTSLDDIELKDAWVSIGTFDGVHLGHQEIIRKLTRGAHDRGLPAIVVTFFPHPAVVLHKRENAFYLTSPEERATLLGQYGVDFVITLPFNDEMAQLDANSFIDTIFHKVQFSTLVEGVDFALGRNRQGNLQSLIELGKKMNFQVVTVPSYNINGEIVSSSQIRSMLFSGQVRLVRDLLGRYYSLFGKVIKGDGRGKTFQIPTANLVIWHERAIPEGGVYACLAYHQDQTWYAVTNIGVRPTFEKTPVTPRVETHLLDFNREIYGELIMIEFIDRIRSEIRFEKKELLISQIQNDIIQARQILDSI